jgi:cyclic-di-GMP-binding protein
MTDKTPVKLRIPRQDLDAHSLFSLSLEGAQSWTNALPVTNTREVAQKLRQAIEELNRVTLPAHQRYDLLEVMRPNLTVAAASLSRRFINQPLVLPAEPQQMAELSDQLFGLASTAYTLVAVHAIRDRESIRDINPARLVCEALQRALYFTGCKIFQRFQLFQPDDKRAWRTLHQLFALAERQHLTQLRIDGVTAEPTTISATWLQPLLLSCCKPNQLRQGDIAAIFQGLRQWSGLATVSASGTGLFAVDISGDQPPTYANSMRTTAGPDLRLIDTGPLVTHLKQLAESGEGSSRQDITFANDVRLHHNILQHMLVSLSSVSTRNFSRHGLQQELQVALGLNSTHYFVAGGLTFAEVLHGRGYRPPASERVLTNPFLIERKRRDPWLEAYADEIHSGEEQAAPDDDGMQHVDVDEETRAVLLTEKKYEDPPLQQQQEEEEQHRKYPVKAINASPGGYCLEWSQDQPGILRSGDILCVREEGSGSWVIASIRWLSQLEGKSSILGIELLSPQAAAWGARIQNQKGELSEPIRVLLLPGIKLVAQPPTLITPRSGFREGQRLTLVRHGEDKKIRLQRQVAATATYSQFEFREAGNPAQVKPREERELPGSAFRSLWSEI